MNSWSRRTVGPLVALVFLVTARPALAGPPFLCHQFDIGSAKSLPWDDAGWWSGRPDYNLRTLVADTEALLTPSTPVLQRMETLRRATLYASADRQVAAQLFEAILERTRAADRRGVSDALAWFDLAYVTESFRETAALGDMPQFRSTGTALASLTGTADPKALMNKILTVKPNEPSIVFAVALLTGGTARHELTRQARAGAAHDSLLARNIRLFLD